VGKSLVAAKAAAANEINNSFVKWDIEKTT
jgi:hypothetical protein